MYRRRRSGGGGGCCRRRARRHLQFEMPSCLLADLPNIGFAKLAAVCNRLFAAHGMTVSKSYVHYTVRKHLHEIMQLRREIKRKKPLDLPRNAVWGLDMTGKADASGRVHAILGFLDHGTRFPVELAVLANKSSWTLLGHLCLAIGRFGKPAAVRTDNERCFTSRVFTWGLALLGIRHQRIDIACPWQNGRGERFFGTLKQSLDEWCVESGQQLQQSLALFRDWYCTVRPHANLDGRTPHEAWYGIDPYREKPKRVEWFEAWDGLLTGIRIRYR